MTADTSLTTSQPLNTMHGFRFVSVKELSEEEKQVLKNSVAKGTTDDELSYFLNVAFAQELNPFQKEVYCIKRAKKNAQGQYDYQNADLIIMTGRDGFLKLAKRDPTFDYIQSSEVREGDHFVMDPITGSIEHRFGPKRGTILGAYAIITRKDKVKVSKYVTWQEYNDPYSAVWKDNPTAMIVKSAESVLCKQFANITGIVAEETMRKDGTVIDSSPSAQAQQSSLKDDLIKQIEACQTMPDFVTLRDTIAGTVGKLFGPEKEAVYAAAKAKKAELEAPARPDMSDKVVKHRDGDPTNNEVSNLEIVDAPVPPPQSPPQAPEMPADEYQEWYDGLRAQETKEGVDDVYKAATEKPMSEPQRAQMELLREECKKQLEPKPKQAKKKAA